MPFPRRPILILAIGALVTGMAFCYVWLDLSLSKQIRTSTATVTPVITEDRLLEVCPYLRGGNTHPRRAETNVDVSLTDSGVMVVQDRQIITTDASDPLLRCVREADRTELVESFPSLLATRLVGYYSIHLTGEWIWSVVNEPVIEAPLADNRAIVTLFAEHRYEISDVELTFSRIETPGEEHLLVPNRITVHGNRYMVNRVVGAPVVRQTSDHVDLAEQVGEGVVEVDLTVHRTPTRDPTREADTLPVSSSLARSGESLEILLSFVLALFPWAVVVFLGRRSVDPVRLVVRGILAGLVVGFVVAIVLAGVGEVGDVEQSARRLGMLALLVGLPLMMLGRLSDRSAWGPVRHGAALIGAIALVIAALAWFIGAGFRLSVWGIPAIVLAGVGGAALGAVVERRRWSWLGGLTFGLVCAAGVVVLRWLDEIAMPHALLGLTLLMWMGLAYRLLAKDSSITRQLLGCAAAVAVGLSPARLSDFLDDGAQGSYLNTGALFVVLWLLSNLGLGVAAVILFRRRGAEPAVVADPLYHGLACAAIFVALQPYFSGAPWAAAGVLVVIGFCWLLRGHTPNAVRLAGASSAVHSRLVGLEGRRQAALNTAKAHFRTAGAAIVNGDKRIEDAARTQSRLDEAAGLARPPDRAAVRLPRAALGSGGGATPWRNALPSALFAAVLSAPFAIYEAVLAVERMENSTTVLFVLGQLTRWGRWVLIGFLFGYFYPAIRGATPIRKAGLLLVVLLPLELLALDFAKPWSTLVLLAAIRVGHLVVFCLSLGLFWEWRLAHAAGFNWGRVRNFSRIRSFLVPATTVLVAAATALASGLAGAAAGGLMRPAEQPPIEAPQPTTSVPGRP